MSKKLTPIQAIIFAVLILAIFFGVILFVVRKGDSGKNAAPITMWGTFSEVDFMDYHRAILDEEENAVNIIYTEFAPEDFEEALIEALASGEGPDTVIMTEELLARHENKLFTVVYDFYPQKTFKDTFVQQGEMLLRPEGTLGFPLLIDPIVMYWNRSTLNNIGVSQPPKIWSELLDIIPKIVVRDSQATVTKAGIALGEFTNVNNVEEILVSLIQQAGNPIISLNEEGELESVIEERMGYKLRPAEAALTFFTQFSNPTKTIYSWNRSMPNSQDMFTAGDLAFYLGFASERETLIKKNPNLNFDVSLLPQSTSGNENSTYGRLYYISILNQSENIGAAFDTVLKLTEASNISKASDIFGMSIVRRDLLVDVPAMSYKQVFNDSSLIAKGVYNMDPRITTEIYKDMIESVTSGRYGVSDSVGRAANEFKELYK